MDPTLLFTNSKQMEQKEVEKPKRGCCMPFCENYVQLVNIQCECTKDKVFNKKHYMCMGCYLALIKSGKHYCPLDRSKLTDIDPFLLSMIETDALIEKLMSTIQNASEQVAQSRLQRNWGPSPTRVRLFETETVTTYVPARLSFPDIDVAGNEPEIPPAGYTPPRSF